MISTYLFWLCLTLIAYTYLVYPLFLVAASKVVGRGRPHHLEALPSVSVVVAVYNEKDVIDEKIKNLLALDYPHDRIEFLIGSDGSNDGTNEMVLNARTANVRLIPFERRRGKASVLNEIIPAASNEIVVLSDANTFYDTDTVQKLVRQFGDPNVGAVCGELVLKSDTGTAGGFGEGRYWEIENAMKRMESDIRTTIGATGAVYAIRKSLFKPLPVDKPVMDDFLIPLNIIREGYSVKYDPEAMAHERPSNSVQGEFRRRVRISAANFHGLRDFRALLNPRYGFAALALWSRKVLRWCVPLLLLVMAAASILSMKESPVIQIAVVCEVLFLLAAAVGFVIDRSRRRTGIFGLPYYFIAMNAALIIGFVKFLFRKQPTTWDVIR